MSMDSQTVQEILDNLDVQLASGAIDLPTYQQLTTKWQARLAMLDSSAGEKQVSVADLGQSIATSISCPECSAPLEELDVAPGTVVQCSFCRATFTTQRAREQTERIGEELRRWVEQLVVESGSDGSVDTASRRFIFAEKLYPALNREYRRAMEPYADVLEHPLVYHEFLYQVEGYQPTEHVLLRNAGPVSRVRALRTKANSPLVRNFALGEDDHRKLHEIDIGTANLVYLANAASLLASPGPESYTSARENLVALSRDYAGYLSADLEPGYKEYVQAVRARLEANARLLDVLATILAPDADFAAQVYLEELQDAGGGLRQAQELVAASTYNPVVTLPLTTGIERDAAVLSLVQALLRSYHTATRSRSQPFPDYCRDLKSLLQVICPHPASPEVLLDALDQIVGVLDARQGKHVLHYVDDWSWVNRCVDGGRRRALFGGEKLKAQTHYWHPYWCATIRYAGVQGRLFVSGVEKVGYGLVDAVAKKVAPQVILDDIPFHATVEQAVHRSRPADPTPFLPAIVSRSDADGSLQQAVRSTENLRNARLAVDCLVYLPAVLVEYEAKSESRQALYVYKEEFQVGKGIVRLLGDVQSFFGCRV